MNICHRIHRLESAIRPADYCGLCGAPGTIALRVVVTTNSDPLPRCTGCGRALDHGGRPLPRHVKRIIRQPRELRILHKA
jgi:hypothetical protein